MYGEVLRSPHYSTVLPYALSSAEYSSTLLLHICMFALFMTLQRFSILSVSAALALCATTVLAQTDTPQSSCSHLSGMERAQCLVKQHRETVQRLGRSSARISSAGAGLVPVEAAASSVSSVQSSHDAGTACSRLYGVARGQCQALRRRNEVQRLSTRPPVRAVSAIGRRPQNCARYRLGLDRERCLAGEKMGGGSSASASSSS